MKVSILVPTRDRVVTLRHTLDGIRLQQHKDIEVIVYDDGSSVESRMSYRAMQMDYGDRFHFITSAPAGGNGCGPNAARNRAFQQSKGELIAFCDDDDFWICPTYLSRVSNLLERHGDIDLCFADQVAVTNTVKTQDTWWIGLDRTALSHYATSTPGFYLPPRKLLLAAGGFPHVNITIIRRSLYTAIGGFWERAYYEGDLNFFYRAIDRARQIALLPDVVSQHNVPDPSKRASVTTRIDRIDRLLGRSMICAHARAWVNDPDVIAAIRETEGYTQRHLAMEFDRDGRTETALWAAALALAIKPGLKWFLYYCALALRVQVRTKRMTTLIE